MRRVECLLLSVCLAACSPAQTGPPAAERDAAIQAEAILRGLRPLPHLAATATEPTQTIARAAAEALQADGEDPSAYWAGPVELDSAARTAELPLWFRDDLAPEVRDMIGNPSGKSHSVIFDLVDGKIAVRALWQ
jgi:hypothetical protein